MEIKDYVEILERLQRLYLIHADKLVYEETERKDRTLREIIDMYLHWSSVTHTRIKEYS